MNDIDEHDKISIISKRDFERKLNIQKQKDLKESSSAKNESIAFFESEFSTKCTEIENLLSISSKIPANNLQEHLNVIFRELLILQKYVAASNLFLRSYDIKRCNDILNNLTNKSKELEDKLLPKKKFGFKNKSKLTNNVKANIQIKDNDVTDFAGISEKHHLFDENYTGFSDKSHESLSFQEDEIFKRNLTINHLINCNVKIFGTPSTLHAYGLQNCTVLCGPVSTSIFASNCENCTFVIACQQLRLHSSRNAKIYLHVTSRAIMEDCVDIQIAPYNLKYEGMEKHFEQSGLDILENNWQAIDDFNWLNSNQHSPNWKVLEECDRQHAWL